MEPQLQGKLLRVLEERAVERVGGLKPVPLGARVIAASHRDLAVLVEEKHFRLDLYHRLMVFPIALPPLRARGDDILLLAEHFLAGFGARFGKRFAALSPAVGEVLRRYPFPGNVRELKNVIERAAIVTSGPELTLASLPPRLLDQTPAIEMSRVTADGGVLNLAFRPGADTLESLERRLLEEALRAAGGKKQRAAELLGISRFALMRRVEKYGL
jgi:DNA-binding NtrC family response regulator